MKKLLVALLTITLGLTTLCGCSLFGGDKTKTRDDYKWISVSTLEDLYGMESNKCYRLEGDIDLQGRPWTPLIVVGFDGNGHTVSNGMIMETVTEGETDYFGNVCFSGFIGKCNWLDNLTVDNFRIVYTASERPRVGFAVGQALEVVNTTVKNCTATVTSGLFCGCVVGYGFQVKSCTAKDCTINGNGVNAAGGIAGQGWTFDDCIVDTIMIESSKVIGGIMATGSTSNGHFKNCSVKNSILTSLADGANSSSDLIGYGVGGIVGVCSFQSDIDKKNAYMENCLSENNIITSKGEGIGGVVGVVGNRFYFKNCLSQGNTLTSTYTGTKFTPRVGGFAGATASSTQSCFAIHNKLNCHSESQSNAYLAGFAAYYTGLYSFKLSETILFCGVYGNIIEGQNKTAYSFSPKNDLIINCYADDENAKEVDYLSEKDWKTASVLAQTFNLSSDYWTLVDGSLPTLKLN